MNPIVRWFVRRTIRREVGKMSEKTKHWLSLAASAVNWSAVLVILNDPALGIKPSYAAFAGLVIQGLLLPLQQSFPTVMKPTPLIDKKGPPATGAIVLLALSLMAPSVLAAEIEAPTPCLRAVQGQGSDPYLVPCDPEGSTILIPEPQGQTFAQVTQPPEPSHLRIGFGGDFGFVSRKHVAGDPNVPWDPAVMAVTNFHYVFAPKQPEPFGVGVGLGMIGRQADASAAALSIAPFVGLSGGNGKYGFDVGAVFDSWKRPSVGVSFTWLTGTLKQPGQ